MGKTRQSANLVSDNNIFVDIVNDRVGIGSTLPTSKLDVSGEVSVDGAITASSFFGDGSGLVGVGVGIGTEDNINTTGIITASSFFGDGSNLTNIDISYVENSGIATVAQGLTGTPDIEVGIVTATTFFGDLTGTATTATVAQGLTGTPDIEVGIVTATTYTVSGSSSTVNETPITIDASQVQYHSRIASFTAARTVEVSNLTPGRWVQIYIRNTNATARTITVQASTTTTGFANVNLAVSTTAGSASAVSFSLAATSGTAVIWVANIDGDIVGSVN
jgi:hypothetical protein